MGETEGGISMKSIATIALESGMVLAKDVYSYQNNLLAKEGDIVDKNLISKLSRYSIMCVDIKEHTDFSNNSYERIRHNNGFLNFETVYHTNLNAYKYMIDTFLEDGISLNLSYLLTLHNNVTSCCKNDEELLTYLYHLILKEEDLSYGHLFNAALLCSILGKSVPLNSKNMKLLILSGFLYDIGKLKLPTNIVWDTRPLSVSDKKLLDSHTQIGYDLLKDLNINDVIKQCTLKHHSDPTSFAGYIQLVDKYEPLTRSHAKKQLPNSVQILNDFNLFIKNHKLEAMYF